MLEKPDLLPCPFCGVEPPEDLIDTLYPSGIYWRAFQGHRSYHGHPDRLPGDNNCWKMLCNVTYGGCGAEVHGDSYEEAVEKWNRRAK